MTKIENPVYTFIHKSEFLSQIQEEFFGVRCQAVKALGELRDQRAVSTLHRIQKEDSSEEVRQEASLSLEKIKTRK